jgi:hypothetical protein
MTLAENVAARCRDMADAELAKLYADTGIDLSMLPSIMTAEELAPAIRSSVGALAQDRYRNRGIPTSGWAGASAMSGPTLPGIWPPIAARPTDMGGRSTKEID